MSVFERNRSGHENKFNFEIKIKSHIVGCIYLRVCI